MNEHANARRVIGLLAEHHQHGTCQDAIADWSRDTRGEVIGTAIGMLYSMVNATAADLGTTVEAWMSGVLVSLDDDEADRQ